MKTRHYALALSALALAAASFAANAAIVFTNLGTGAPPSTLGGYSMTMFSPSAQAAIPDSYGTPIYVIPGGPSGSTITVAPGVYKATATISWNSSWSHGYTGPMYYSGSVTQATLTLPAGTKAFFLYTQSNYYGTYNMTVSTNSGATSGPVAVNMGQLPPTDGATGFAFHATAGETISSVTITGPGDGSGFAFGEFGINGGVATTCASEGYTGTKLLWCQNICEKGYTGAQLDTWIHRWINRYRDLPYCAQEGGGEEEPPPQQPT